MPVCGDERFLLTVNQQMLITLGMEQKLLPTTVVNQFAKARVTDIEAQQGYKVGRKELKEIKEQMTDELLPRAFSLRSTTSVWIDPVQGWLVIDAASPAKAEVVLELLSKTLENFPLALLHTQLAPTAAMTDWLATGEAPDGFSIDRELELRASGESKATVRYANHALEGDEIREHIAAGKRATRLGLTWNDRISFVLTEQLHIKKLSFLDIIKEESAAVADSEAELLALDFTLMAGELSKLLTDLTLALGGEIATV
jgi:recombination associated protein RdgC